MSDIITSPERIEALRRNARHFAGDADVLALSAIAQPLVDDLQSAIRYQRQVINELIRAINYTLTRVRRDERLSNILGAGTQTYELLTQAQASAEDLDVDQLRDYILPGSAKFHRARKNQD